jgi:hypothetical protein
MSANYGGPKIFTRSSKDEPFHLDHRDWNAVTDFLRSYLGWTAQGDPTGEELRHAWKMQVTWNSDISRWTISVNPGFVRGHEVFVTTAPTLVPEESRKRLGIEMQSETDIKTKVEVSLLDNPLMFVPTKMWRPVATDAPTLDTVATKVVPRSIRERYNTIVSGKIKAGEGQVESGVVTDSSASLEQDRETARLAYCVEVVLRQPRFSVQFAPPTESLDRNYLELIVEKVNPKNNPPYLELTRQSPIEIEASENVTVQTALDGVDPGYDTLPIATVWMLGPMGELELDEVNESWSPVVQYHTFYNVDHTVEIDINKIPPYRQLNPAAGLLSGIVVQAAVEIVNELNRVAEQAFQSISIKGKFWTV